MKKVSGAASAIILSYIMVCFMITFISYRTQFLLSQHSAMYSSKNQNNSSNLGTMGSVSSNETLKKVNKLTAKKSIRPFRNGQYKALYDQIIAQLTFKPNHASTIDIKTIYIPHGSNAWYIKDLSKTFESCGVRNCRLTQRPDDGCGAHAVVFRNSVHEHLVPPTVSCFYKNPNQIWILYTLENPENTPFYDRFLRKRKMNWTATYRADSDIATPYGMFISYPERILSQKRLSKRPIENFAKNKSKLVVWFASNCFTPNNRRDYVRELSAYIDVDIYGACGSLACPRGSPHCTRKLDKDYKFYLAFENANCRGYISEKLFDIALKHNVVPVVMGAPKTDYEGLAPPNSFIHVDDFPGGPQELAEYLLELDKNDTAYSEYFAWKGTGEFLNTGFWCRLCSKLHTPQPRAKFYNSLDAWWRPQGICAKDSPRLNMNTFI